MKIIEKVDTSNWSLECKCKECETKLEIEATDLRYYLSERDGIHPASDNYSVQCVVCSNYIYIPVGSIPKIVQIEAQQRSRRNSYLD